MHVTQCSAKNSFLTGFLSQVCIEDMFFSTPGSLRQKDTSHPGPNHLEMSDTGDNATSPKRGEEIREQAKQQSLHFPGFQLSTINFSHKLQHGIFSTSAPNFVCMHNNNNKKKQYIQGPALSNIFRYPLGFWKVKRESRQLWPYPSYGSVLCITKTLFLLKVFHHCNLRTNQHNSLNANSFCISLTEQIYQEPEKNTSF